LSPQENSIFRQQKSNRKLEFTFTCKKDVLHLRNPVHG